MDKYEGRVLTEDGFKNALKDFLYNGEGHRTELIKIIVKKLKNLLQLLEKTEACRFYCSSLLLVYDGDITNNDVEVKMIDFAQSRVKEEPNNNHVGPDKGYILGLKSLINIYSDFDKEYNKYLTTQIE